MLPKKYHITLYAMIVGLALILFSPYIAVANDGKEQPCNNIKLLNKASLKQCQAKGWGKDTKGRWVQKTVKKQLKTPVVVGDATKKVPEQKIYWTEGKRIHPDHVGHLPKGGWR
jgi:hypothetical protein